MEERKASAPITTHKGRHYSFLAKNIVWLQVGQVFSKVASLLALPIVTAFLSPDAYGIVALFTIEASFLSSLYSLGLDSFAGRMIYKFDRRNKKTCGQYLTVSLLYIAIFAFFGSILSIPFTNTMKEFIFRGIVFPHRYLSYVPVIQSFFMCIYSSITCDFLNLQENKNIFLCELVYFIVFVPLEIIGLVWLDFTWVEIVVLQCVAQMIVAVVSLSLIRHRLVFSFKRLKVIGFALRYSLPFYSMNFSSWIQQQIDKILLGRIRAVSSVGVYSLGTKISEGYQFFSRPISISVKPDISKRLDMRDKNINRDIGEFFTLFFQVSLFIIFSLSIFSREIIDLLTNVTYSSAFTVVPFGMFGYFFSELTGIFGLKMVYKNKTVFFTFVTFLGALLSALLNYALIPRFGIIGAASATVLTNLTILMIAYMISQSLHVSAYHLRRNILTLLIVAFLVYLVVFHLPYTIPMFFLKGILLIGYGILLYLYIIKTNRIAQGLIENVFHRLQAKFDPRALDRG